jgi:recombination protein RecA
MKAPIKGKVVVNGRSEVEHNAGAAQAKAPNATVESVHALTASHTKEQQARSEALSGVVHQIERSYGKGSILKLGQTSSINVETFPSGSVTLDMAMGGGYPRGRVIEIYGPESSGKTTLALHAVAEMQRQGGTPCARWT